MNPLTEFRKQLRREIQPRRWMKTCPACHGDGCVVEKEESYSFSIYEMCAMCNGSGKVEAKIRQQLRKEIQPRRWMKPCPACHGDGCVVEKEESYSFSIYEMCAMCNGSGKVKAKI